MIAQKQEGEPTNSCYSKKAHSGMKRCLYHGGLLTSFFVCLFLLSPQKALATNYFNWGVEDLRPSWGINGTAQYEVQFKSNTVQDCTVSHSGSCSMRINVRGDDNGNGPSGADLIGPKPTYPWNFVGSTALYYRWWMRIEPGFSWGSGTAKVKSSRVGGVSYPRGYTGYIMSYGFLIGECGEAHQQPGGGCLLNNGATNTDSNLFIRYDFRNIDDGAWHEYIVKIKPNTNADCTAGTNCDAEFEAWVDGVSVGQNNNYKLHDETGNYFKDLWGSWMVYPYWQLNGTPSDGGTIYIDDVSTDDVYNSIYSGGTPAPSFTFSANPNSITGGESSTLAWGSVTNATSCTASGGTFTGSKSTSGGNQSVSPGTTTTYTLSCVGPGGATNKNATVTVGGSGGRECESNWKTVHPEWIWCDDFETDKSSLHVDHNGWGTTLVRSSGQGYTGTYSLRATFPAAPGSTANGGDFTVSFGKSPVSPKIDPADNTKYQELYWRAFIKTQPGWQPGKGMKFTRATSFVSSNWTQAMISHWWGAGTPENLLAVDPASGVCQGGVYPAGSPVCTNNTVITNGWNDFNGLYWLGSDNGSDNIMGPAAADTWRCVEGYVKLNTPGNSDGVQTLWIDGVQEANKTELNFMGTYSDYGINVFRLENYMNEGVSSSQYRDWDNLVLSTTRIGCSVDSGGGATPPAAPQGLRILATP